MIRSVVGTRTATASFHTTAISAIVISVLGHPNSQSAASTEATSPPLFDASVRFTAPIPECRGTLYDVRLRRMIARVGLNWRFPRGGYLM